MATYAELRSLFNHDATRNLIEVAIIVAAEKIRTEDAGTANHANRLLWAKAAFANPTGTAQQMLMALLATNRALTVPQITGATDAAIQTAVDAAINVFADGT
jgi:hypothetical protein